MKYAIYGAGYRCSKLLNHIGTDCVGVIIDRDIDKQGTTVNGIPVISLDEYKTEYSDLFIFLTPADFDINDVMKYNSIYNYTNIRDLPSEFMGYGLCTFEECYGILEDKITEEVVIYGLNVFGLMLYDRLKNCCAKISFIEEDYCEREKKKWAVNHNYPFKEQKNLTFSETILVTCIDHTAEFLLQKNGINMLYFSSNCPKYSNPVLKKFNKIKKGEKCFIVATGPSLTSMDLKKLKNNNCFCFSMNEMLFFDEFEWVPDIFVVTDSQFINKYRDMLNRYKCNYKMIGDSCYDFDYDNDNNIYKFHLTADDFTQKDFLFSENISQNIFAGSTVTYSCIQIAVYMGFTEIYLLGVDCSYIEGSNDNHFIKTVESDVNMDYETSRMVNAYKVAKKYSDEHGIRILNATRGGKLEVFPRVDFEKVLEDNRNGNN